MSTQRTTRVARTPGFTLIELLVVIAIIGLLVSLLLPALGKAKKAALMSRSLSNIRQLTISAKSYQSDFKGLMPITPVFVRRSESMNPNSPVQGFEGMCTWSFAGKNNQSTWANLAFDVEAVDRPLNPYITPEIIDQPAAGENGRMQAHDPVRTSLEVEVCKDPSDKLGHQGAGSVPGEWPSENRDGSTCYEDVGTSYHFNIKWLYQRDILALWNRGGTAALRGISYGAQRMALADAFDASRFVWVNDEYADIVVNQTQSTFKLKNGYDDINKSIMGFMDGHAGYFEVFPGGWVDPDGGRSFNNARYTFVFPFLRAPLN